MATNPFEENMKLIHTTFRIFSAGALLFLYSCSGDPATDSAITESTLNTQDASAEETSENVSKMKDIFYSVPSPMDMASLLKRAGAQYDMSLLNDVKRVNDYTSSRSRALNLGIYGADLSYASIFNQNQESIIYLSCTKKLADNLGVTKAFDENTIERMESNVENRDSLLNIVSETYYMLDAYLKENDRDHISAMVIAAGWVEGLYLAATIAHREKEPEAALLTRIAEQKLSLDNLVDLVTAYNSKNQLDDILDDLSKIEASFNDVSIKKQKTTVHEAEDGTTIIGGETSSKISPETLSEITKVVSEIRQRYVS